jgi:hypothetical protein
MHLNDHWTRSFGKQENSHETAISLVRRCVLVSLVRDAREDVLYEESAQGKWILFFEGRCR